mmetsp:Transcript_33649/g.74512  ORF Transcript_33649/g.74512 Transcript_33649/m.74512 type:complete len:240 (-) Transcript_33649:1037-1756(-)
MADSGMSSSSTDMHSPAAWSPEPGPSAAPASFTRGAATLGWAPGPVGSAVAPTRPPFPEGMLPAPAVGRGAVASTPEGSTPDACCAAGATCTAVESAGCATCPAAATSAACPACRMHGGAPATGALPVAFTAAPAAGAPSAASCCALSSSSLASPGCLAKAKGPSGLSSGPRVLYSTWVPGNTSMRSSLCTACRERASTGLNLKWLIQVGMASVAAGSESTLTPRETSLPSMASISTRQ